MQGSSGQQPKTSAQKILQISDRNFYGTILIPSASLTEIPTGKIKTFRISGLVGKADGFSYCELLIHTFKHQVLTNVLCSDSRTDYGRPMKPFFIEIQNFWAWADKFWGILGTIVGRTISTHFGTVSPLSMFSIIQPLFLQKICWFFGQFDDTKMTF